MYIAIGVGVVIVLFVVFYIKISIDEKKGENSAEKQKIKEIIKEKTGSDDYISMYATWESMTLGGGRRRIVKTTSYQYYAIGFKKGDLVVVPLSFEKGVMAAGIPTHYTKENVTIVNTKPDKNWLELYDQYDNPLVSIIVAPVETKEDRYHPVNIVQKEEYNAFLEFAKDFMHEVNDYHHVTATGKIGKAK